MVLMRRLKSQRSASVQFINTHAIFVSFKETNDIAENFGGKP